MSPTAPASEGFPDPVTVLRPAGAPGRFVFASPHSGREYPGVFLKRSSLPLRLLRRSEDAHVEALFAAAPAHGAPLVLARFPRAYVDVNREPDELDPAMFEPRPELPGLPTHRASAGLGVIPRIAADGRAIYSGPLPEAEIAARIAACYRPYHAALAAEIETARALHGEAVLIDCHSMPSGTARGADVVLGDRFGASCSRELIADAEAAFRALGLKVARNRPYAGGRTTEHYGRPAAGVHALQVEISRGLYLDELNVEPSSGFEPLRSLISEWISALAGEGRAALAAE
jgi:N-formylglutamate amidohydrolase